MHYVNANSHQVSCVANAPVCDLCLIVSVFSRCVQVCSRCCSLWESRWLDGQDGHVSAIRYTTQHTQSII